MLDPLSKHLSEHHYTLIVALIMPLWHWLHNVTFCHLVALEISACTHPVTSSGVGVTDNYAMVLLEQVFGASGSSYHPCVKEGAHGLLTSLINVISCLPCHLVAQYNTCGGSCYEKAINNTMFTVL